MLLDAAAGQVLAEGHTIPVTWDGTDAGLGPGLAAHAGLAHLMRRHGRT